MYLYFKVYALEKYLLKSTYLLNNQNFWRRFRSAAQQYGGYRTFFIKGSNVFTKDLNFAVRLDPCMNFCIARESFCTTFPPFINYVI